MKLARLFFTMKRLLLIFLVARFSFGDCEKISGTERPPDPPVYSSCTLKQTSGCNGWKPLSDILREEDILGVLD